MAAFDVIKKISKEFNENVNSHAFLFETDNVEEATKDVKEIIKKVLKSDENTGKQIDDDNYIELIIIKPDGKDIKKDSILELQERIKTKPILSDYIFYIIEHAELLNESASNKLLKTIEEPNDNVIGFLISNNTSIMLPTIKSRCEIEAIYYQEKSTTNIDEKTIENAKKIIEIIENKDLKDYIIYENKEKDYLKENGKTIANIIKDYYNTASNIEFNEYADKNTIEHIRKYSNPQTIIKKAEYLNNTLDKLSGNMNAQLLLTSIVIELKEVMK